MLMAPRSIISWLAARRRRRPAARDRLARIRQAFVAHRRRVPRPFDGRFTPHPHSQRPHVRPSLPLGSIVFLSPTPDPCLLTSDLFLAILALGALRARGPRGPAAMRFALCEESGGYGPPPAGVGR